MFKSFINHIDFGYSDLKIKKMTSDLVICETKML